MQCDGQYCLTEMENSFVGQVICRNCGFSLLPLSLSLSLFFSLSSSLPLSVLVLFPLPRKLDCGASKTTKVLILITRSPRSTNKFYNRARFLVYRFLFVLVVLTVRHAAQVIKSAHSAKRDRITPNVITIFLSFRLARNMRRN